MMEAFEGTVVDESQVPEHSLRLVLVTGMSGAGRSTAARALEDLGWFVIDNMPPSLLESAIDLARHTPDVERVAVVLDARSGSFFARIDEIVRTLPRDGVDVRVVYLEASDEALVRRFESSRRPHPLQHGARILDGLQAERQLLGDLRAKADLVIDTTSINVHDLRRRIEDAFGEPEPVVLSCTVVSFGFKYGIPVDSDMVADVRFLPNPFWDEAAAAPHRARRAGRRRCARSTRCSGVPRHVLTACPDRRRRLHPRGQALCHRRHRVHGRQAPQRGHVAGPGHPTDRQRDPHHLHAPRSRSRMSNHRGARLSGTLGRRSRRRVVALGGGHGLAASLQGLRRVTDSLTAVVGVADDGGSSGRLRQEFGIIPPGDLRMALAALCGDDSWGRTWQQVIQHGSAARASWPATASGTCSSRHCGSRAATP